jgi:hypothetical protein
MMITVADQDTLRERFKAIGGDWLAEKLTPKFAARAGRELVAPEGVNLAVDCALYDICQGLPAPTVAALRMSRDAIRAALAAEAPVA